VLYKQNLCLVLKPSSKIKERSITQCEISKQRRPEAGRQFFFMCEIYEASNLM
jgi:hypothetical protein